MPVSAPRSNSTLGQQLTLRARSPATSGSCVTRTLGVRRGPSPTSTSALGSSAPQDQMPRGRCSLKLRPTRRTPLASSAEASVSPGQARRAARR